MTRNPRSDPRLRRSTVPAAAAMAAAALVGGCGDTSGRTDGGWFPEITEEAGLDFLHESGAAGKLHMPEIVGPGAAFLDYDGDGDLDIYVTNGNGTLPEAGRSEAHVNRLYRQEADGTFSDVTESSGLGDGGYGMGVAVGDIDNDGLLDLYVTNYGWDRLYRNRGGGTFEDVTDRSGVSVGGWSCSAAFLDYDRDGFLDLYVTRFVEFNPKKNCFEHAGRPEIMEPALQHPLLVFARRLLFREDPAQDFHFGGAERIPQPHDDGFFARRGLALDEA